jgi:exonuclease SbcC
MILSELELSNFKNFREKRVEFEPGINVLQGPNGSGKTTILEGVEFALYGSVGGKTGLEPLIKVGETTASASLAFQVQEGDARRQYRVFRQMTRGETGTSTTGAYLNRDGIEVTTRKSAVDDRVLDMLGIAHTAYGNSCFLRQGEIRALLEAGKEREREIDRMMGLGVFEDAWKDLRKTESDLEKKVASTKEELIRAEAELRNLSSVRKDLTERIEEKVRLEAQSKEAEGRLGDLSDLQIPAGPSGDFVRLEKARAVQVQKVEGLKDQIGQLEDRIEAVNERLLELEAELLRRENRIEGLKDEEESLAGRISKAKEESELGRTAANELESEISKAEAKLGVHEDLIKVFSQMEVKRELQCPICGSELTPDHARETRKSLDSRMRSLQELVEGRRNDLRRFRKSEEGTRSRLERLENQLSDVRSERAEAEAQNSGVRLAKEEMDAETGTLMSQKRELEKELESERHLLEELEKQAAGSPDEMAVDEEVAKSRAAYLANRQILERLEKEIPQLMERLAEEQMKKAALAKARDEHSNLSQDLEIIQDIRWAFNNIGPYARSKMLSAVSERTRELFRRIYSGGTITDISLGQDYDVSAKTEDGVQLPSRLLSVGERVIAGLALRIALAQIWPGAPGQDGEGPGFLILDEPTEYLDESNVRSLAGSIANLRALGQVIIVTHDRQLMEEIARGSEINRIVLPGTPS